MVSRSPGRGARAAELAGAAGRLGDPEDAVDCDLLVNATPLGMEGTAGMSGELPVDPSWMRKGQLVVDLVYHPAETPWLVAAGARGADTANGLGMLVHQAALQLRRMDRDRSSAARHVAGGGRSRARDLLGLVRAREAASGSRVTLSPGAPW